MPTLITPRAWLALLVALLACANPFSSASVTAAQCGVIIVLQVCAPNVTDVNVLDSFDPVAYSLQQSRTTTGVVRATFGSPTLGLASTWHATAQATALTRVGGGGSIPATNVRLSAIDVPRTMAGLALTIGTVTVGPPAASLATPNILQRFSGVSISILSGDYRQDMTIEVTIPPMTPPGTYTGVLTVTTVFGAAP